MNSLEKQLFEDWGHDMDLLEEFESAGLLPERVVPNMNNKTTKEIPKVNPNMDQHVGATKADINKDQASEPSKAGDQNKDDDPTTKADETYEDKSMASAMAGMSAAEAALDNICYQCDKGDNEYEEDKKQKLHEIHENVKSLKSGLYEMATMQRY